MANKDVSAPEAPVEHIGPRRHIVRTIALTLGIGVLIAALGLAMFRQEPEPAAAELSQFRAAMFNQCKHDAFRGPPDATLIRKYNESAELRQAVVAQYHRLQRNQGSCQEIIATLRAAGYPL
ncbi:MAG: hypothetical protein RMK29_21460 [Myxococcales bacterium]|nr:hypothetical protein [Myxococcota bacterium]MDW8284280.1 hypothetical protein [Myxococcales bacterium]